MAAYVAIGRSIDPYLYVAEQGTGLLLPFGARPPIASVAGLAFTADASKLATAHTRSSGIALSVYALPGMTVSSPAADPGGSGKAVAYSPDGTRLAFGMDISPYAIIYNASTLVDVGASLGLTGTVSALAYSPDGTRLAIGYAASPYLKVYDTATWSAVTLTTAVGSAVTGLAYSPDGTRLAVCHSSSPYLSIYNTSTWTKVSGTPTDMPGNSGHPAYSPDGTRLAVVLFGGTHMKVYNTSTWATVSGTPTLPGQGNSVAYSPDGAYVLVGTTYVTGTPRPVRAYSTSSWADTTSGPLGNLLAAASCNSNSLAVAFSTPTLRYIRGSVRDVSNSPVARTVRVLARPSGALVATTVSNGATGDFEVAIPAGASDEFDVQFLAASGELLNDLFYARVTTSAI